MRCFYCGSDKCLATDHVVPTSRGGSDEPGNKVVACFTCNSSKCDMLPSEWLVSSRPRAREVLSGIAHDALVSMLTIERDHRSAASVPSRLGAHACAHCAREFVATKSWARFCGDRCRNASHRRKVA